MAKPQCGGAQYLKALYIAPNFSFISFSHIPAASKTFNNTSGS